MDDGLRHAVRTRVSTRAGGGGGEVKKDGDDGMKGRRGGARTCW